MKTRENWERNIHTSVSESEQKQRACEEFQAELEGDEAPELPPEQQNSQVWCHRQLPESCLGQRHIFWWLSLVLFKIGAGISQEREEKKRRVVCWQKDELYQNQIISSLSSYFSFRKLRKWGHASTSAWFAQSISGPWHTKCSFSRSWQWQLQGIHPQPGQHRQKCHMKTLPSALKPSSSTEPALQTLRLHF